jgi:hypothetical protein
MKSELLWGKIRGTIEFWRVKKRHGRWEKKSSDKYDVYLSGPTNRVHKLQATLMKSGSHKRRMPGKYKKKIRTFFFLVKIKYELIYECYVDVDWWLNTLLVFRLCKMPSSQQWIDLNNKRFVPLSIWS